MCVPCFEHTVRVLSDKLFSNKIVVAKKTHPHSSFGVTLAAILVVIKMDTFHSEI
jgi:hypothetical protein